MNRSMRTVAAIIAKAKAGVDYSPRTGATCPCCGALRLRVETSRPWRGNLKVRFHVCTNPACLLCRLGLRVKSVEVDATTAPKAAASSTKSF